MAEIVSSLEEYYVGRVVGYNTETRELDVFIPKLMPGIADGQKDIEIMTNFGNPTVNIKHNEKIITSSSIRLRALDQRYPIPDIDSKVLVWFLEGLFGWGFWMPFNVNGDHNIIEEEKYNKLNYLTISDSQTLVKEFDDVQIELPQGFSVVLTEDTERKIKKFKITQDQEILNKISLLENKVGNDDGIYQYTDENGETKRKSTIASGIFKKINKVNNRVDDLEMLIGHSGFKYEYTQITENNYENNFEYFIFSNGEYNELEMNSLETINDKEQFLESLITEGFKVYKGKKVLADDPSGLIAKIEGLEKRLKILESKK